MPDDRLPTLKHQITPEELAGLGRSRGLTTNWTITMMMKSRSSTSEAKQRYRSRNQVAWEIKGRESFLLLRPLFFYFIP